MGSQIKEKKWELKDFCLWNLFLFWLTCLYLCQALAYYFQSCHGPPVVCANQIPEEIKLKAPGSLNRFTPCVMNVFQRSAKSEKKRKVPGCCSVQIKSLPSDSFFLWFSSGNAPSSTWDNTSCKKPSRPASSLFYHSLPSTISFWCLFF